MKIETERLELAALTPGQLELLVNHIDQLEKELNCSYQAEPLAGVFREIVEGQLRITQNDPDNYVWHSFWLLIRKSDRVAVGSADFKCTPNEKGEVEIGYGLGKEFEHHGYMTEAVKAMCGWALNQENVKHVIAETELDGTASQKILKTCGFKEVKRNETVWWTL